MSMWKTSNIHFNICVIRNDFYRVIFNKFPKICFNCTNISILEFNIKNNRLKEQVFFSKTTHKKCRGTGCLLNQMQAGWTIDWYTKLRPSKVKTPNHHWCSDFRQNSSLKNPFKNQSTQHAWWVHKYLVRSSLSSTLWMDHILILVLICLILGRVQRTCRNKISLNMYCDL